MEKNQDLSQEFEQMREQFRMLTEKVEKQNIVTDQLIREVSKRKVFRYDFIQHYALILVALFTSACGAYMTFDQGYPFWTSLSFFYMSGLLITTTYKHYESERKYLESINYDMATFWKRKDAILKKKPTFKSLCILFLEISPIIVHGVFLARYLRSIGEIKIPGDYWWVCLIGLVCLLIISIIFFGKVYSRTVLDLFRDDEK